MTAMRGYRPRLTSGSGPDARYKAWIHSEPPRVPAAVVIPWIDKLVAEHGFVNTAAKHADIQERVLRGVKAGERARITYNNAERLASAAGRLTELAGLFPPAGLDGWSEVGRSCGDGSIQGEGCGTWFHEHHNAALCEECFGREYLGIGPVIPRDVRVSMEVMR